MTPVADAGETPLYRQDEQRWVDRRAQYLRREYGLRDRLARTLAWSDLGYSSSGIAKRRLDRVHGPRVPRRGDRAVRAVRRVGQDRDAARHRRRPRGGPRMTGVRHAAGYFRRAGEGFFRPPREAQLRLQTERRGEGRRGVPGRMLPRRVHIAPFSSGPVNRFPQPAAALGCGRHFRHRARRSPAATRRPATTMCMNCYCTTGAPTPTAAAVRGGGPR